MPNPKVEYVVKEQYEMGLNKSLSKLYTERNELQVKIDQDKTNVQLHSQMHQLNIKIRQKRSRLENYGKQSGLDSVHVPSGTKMSY